MVERARKVSAFSTAALSVVVVRQRKIHTELRRFTPFSYFYAKNVKRRKTAQLGKRRKSII